MARFYRFVHRLFGDRQCGNTVPPGDWLTTSLAYPPVVRISEDAFTLWMGTDDEWLCQMSRTDARKLALWIIFRWWIWSEWFGLRRVIWYWALNGVCKSYKPFPTPEPADAQEVRGE